MSIIDMDVVDAIQGCARVFVTCSNKDGMIQFPEFLALTHRYPLAMFPLFKMQIQVQRVTLGQDEWMKVKNRVDVMLEASANKAKAPPGAA